MTFLLPLFHKLKLKKVFLAAMLRVHLDLIKVLGFVLEKKNSVPTELDEFRKNSDEFRTQFVEFSEYKA
jgi:hypothetical protein